MAGERRRAAAVLVVSALGVAAVAVAAFVSDTDLSGVRPSFGSGVDPSTGNRVLADFRADQDAMYQAIAGGDQGRLEGYLTGNALQDVAQQIPATAPAPNSTVEISVQPQSLGVVRSSDPNDPGVVLLVQEDAVKTVKTTTQNAAPTEQQTAFHGDFWMREVGGRYLITDQSIQVQPASPWSALGLVALALAWVAAAGLLFARQRRRAPEAVEAGAAGLARWGAG
jgi:hypothetical protein